MLGIRCWVELVPYNMAVQAESLGTRDVFGANICKLDSRRAVDWLGSFVEILFVGVGGISGYMTDAIGRISGLDDINDRLTILVDWDWSIDWVAEEVLDRSSDCEYFCRLERYESLERYERFEKSKSSKD